MTSGVQVRGPELPYPPVTSRTCALTRCPVGRRLTSLWSVRRTPVTGTLHHSECGRSTDSRPPLPDSPPSGRSPELLSRTLFTTVNAVTASAPVRLSRTHLFPKLLLGGPGGNHYRRFPLQSQSLARRVFWKRERC